MLALAVRLHLEGRPVQAGEVAEWVRAAWPTEPIPEVLGIVGAPVAKVDREKHLMDTLLSAFLERRRIDPAIREGTLQRDKGKIENHIKPLLGAEYIEDLTEDRLRTVFHDLSTKPKVRPYYDPATRGMVDPAPGEKLLGPSPLRDIYTILNLVIKDAMKRGWIDENPLAGIKRATRSGMEGKTDRSGAFSAFDRLIDDLTPDESRQFLLAFLGLRQSERLGLGRESVQRDGNTVVLVIDRQLSREGLEVTPLLKTRSSQRAFAVPPSLGLYLLELVKWRESIGPIGPYDTLISNQDGRPLRHQTDTNRWHKLLASRDLPIYRGHLLRHWAATYLAKNGVGEALARGLLGHSDALMTRYYTARESLDVASALTGLADRLLPDYAYLNAADAPSLDDVRDGSPAAYVDTLLTQAAEHSGSARLVRWEAVDDVEHEIALDLEGTITTYRGVIPAGIDPARLLGYITERWSVTSRETTGAPSELEDF